MIDACNTKLLGKKTESIKFIKMNIEGGEYLVGTEWIGRIEDIQIQFHNCGEEYVQRRNGIRQELPKIQYLTYDYAWTFENWRIKAAQ